MYNLTGSNITQFNVVLSLFQDLYVFFFIIIIINLFKCLFQVTVWILALFQLSTIWQILNVIKKLVNFSSSIPKAKQIS